MKNIFCILLTTFLVFGCSGTSSNTKKQIASNEVIVTWPEGTENLNISPEKAKKIRPLLEVYYTNNKVAWAKARSEILTMGIEGKHALCLFFIKFFAAGKQSFGEIDKHWTFARYELAAMGEFAVPYLISTMSLSSMGSTGKIQCAKSLALIGKPAVPALLENLEKGDDSFQCRIIETLGDISKNTEATKPLVDYYKKLREQAPENEIESEVDTHTYGKRIYIISSLRKIKNYKEATSTIEWALSDPNRSVRKVAIEASIAYAAPEHIYLLKKAEKVSRIDFPLSQYHTQINTIIYGYEQ